MPTVSDSFHVNHWAFVQVQGVLVWKLTIDGVTTILPEPSEFIHDDVKQGGYHQMLSGKQRRDILGIRQHFGLRWNKLEPDDAAVLNALFDAAAISDSVLLTTRVGTFRVILANIEPYVYDYVGYIDAGVAFEETS